MKKSALIAVLSAAALAGCGKHCPDIRDTQACHLLLQAFETAEGMSPGWLNRTVVTLESECDIYLRSPDNTL